MNLGKIGASCPLCIRASCSFSLTVHRVAWWFAAILPTLKPHGTRRKAHSQAARRVPAPYGTQRSLPLG